MRRIRNTHTLDFRKFIMPRTNSTNISEIIFLQVMFSVKMY
jgi:hypothetical protein